MGNKVGLIFFARHNFMQRSGVSVELTTSGMRVNDQTASLAMTWSTAHELRSLRGGQVV